MRPISPPKIYNSPQPEASAQIIYGDFPPNYFKAIAEQCQVVASLLLRDMQTRFGRSFVGYVIIVFWPLTHALILLSIFTLTRRVVPIGTDVTTFVGTGVLPYIICLYPTRNIMICLFQNHQLLYFPIIKPFDIILARVLLETITAFWVIALFIAVLFVAGLWVPPANPEQALLAVLATLFFSISIGVYSAVIYKIFKAWLAIQYGLLILMYITSGTVFIPSALPSTLRFYIYFNPLMHSVEWLRTAFYDGYYSSILDKGYLFGFSISVLILGLVAEKLFRGLFIRP